MTQTRTKAVQSIYLMPLLFIFLFIPSHLHAQDDDDLHFKVSKGSLKINTYHDYHLRKGNLDFHVKPKFTYDDTHNTSSKNGFLAMASDSALVNRSKSGTETESKTTSPTAPHSTKPIRSTCTTSWRVD